MGSIYRISFFQKGELYISELAPGVGKSLRGQANRDPSGENEGELSMFSISFLGAPPSAEI